MPVFVTGIHLRCRTGAELDATSEQEARPLDPSDTTGITYFGTSRSPPPTNSNQPFTCLRQHHPQTSFPRRRDSKLASTCSVLKFGREPAADTAQQAAKPSVLMVAWIPACAGMTRGRCGNDEDRTWPDGDTRIEHHGSGTYPNRQSVTSTATPPKCHARVKHGMTSK